MNRDSTTTDETAAALVRVASYLGRPQRFMAIGDARAELRRTLALAAKGSVVLTSHGEPTAAVVPFTTLEDMRRALLHLLVAEMEASYAHSQDRLTSRRREAEPSTEEVLKHWSVKHCAERDDRVINLAVRFRAGDRSASANKPKRGRFTGRCRRADCFDDVSSAPWPPKIRITKATAFELLIEPKFRWLWTPGIISDY